jgi:HEAT repeat protein
MQKDLIRLFEASKYKESYSRRYQAVVALERLGDLHAVESLIEVLEDDNGEVQGAASEALRLIGDTRAVEPLINLLDLRLPSLRWIFSKRLASSAKAHAGSTSDCAELIEFSMQSRSL